MRLGSITVGLVVTVVGVIRASIVSMVIIVLVFVGSRTTSRLSRTLGMIIIVFPLGMERLGVLRVVLIVIIIIIIIKIIFIFRVATAIFFFTAIFIFIVGGVIVHLLHAKLLEAKVARWQNLIPTFSWIGPQSNKNKFCIVA